MAPFRKLYLKSDENADCPDTSSTRVPWLRSIVKRQAAISSIGFLQSRVPNILSLAVLIARRRLGADLGRSRLLVAAVNDEHFRGARQLLFEYGAAEALRTLDALQLSVALGLKRAGLVTMFVAADQKLRRAATLEIRSRTGLRDGAV